MGSITCQNLTCIFFFKASLGKNALDLADTSVKNLDEAMEKIQLLQERLEELEYRVPKRYPEVNFLNYKERKRILVRN